MANTTKSRTVRGRITEIDCIQEKDHKPISRIRISDLHDPNVSNRETVEIYFRFPGDLFHNPGLHLGQQVDLTLSCVVVGGED